MLVKSLKIHGGILSCLTRKLIVRSLESDGRYNAHSNIRIHDIAEFIMLCESLIYHSIVPVEVHQLK